MGLQVAATFVAANLFAVLLLIWTPATVDAVREYNKTKYYKYYIKKTNMRMLIIF